MATYKKRGFKNKSFSNKTGDIGQKSATANVFNTLDEGASKTEKWVAKNQKYIFGLIGFTAIVVLGYFGYFKYITIGNGNNAVVMGKNTWNSFKNPLSIPPLRKNPDQPDKNFFLIMGLPNIS